MSVFSNPHFDSHEHVSFVEDAQSGLKAIIAIHSTVCGPGAGGVRMWAYESEADALGDVLRLSQGMSYKNALAGLSLGGAKAVIIGEPAMDKNPEMLRAFGRAVAAQYGRYVTAGDVGMTPDDMQFVAQETRYVTGLPSGSRAGNSGGGDPSPYTAHGLFSAMRAALSHAGGSADFSGKRVAIQGVGKVGGHLARSLIDAGAHVLVSGRNQSRTKEFAYSVGAEVVDPASLLFAPVDILSPCALGGVFDDETIARLHCKMIVGGANNQLVAPRHGAALQERGILYVPDYVCNAGGMMSVAIDYEGRFVSKETTLQSVERIGDTVATLLKLAEKRRSPTNLVADNMARRMIEGMRTA